MGTRARWKRPGLPWAPFPSGGQAPVPEIDRILMNRTPNRLRITGRGGASLTLAPFERCKVPASKLRLFALGPLIDAGVVDNLPCKQVGPPAWPLILAVTSVCVPLAVSLAVGSSVLSGLMLVVALLAMGAILSAHPPRKLASSVPGLFGRLAGFCVEMRWRVADQFSLGLVGLVSVVLPGLAVANAVHLEVARSGQSLVAFFGGTDGPGLLIGYGLQWLFVTTLSIMPAALYFLFDRERLGALSGRFVRQAFRLDPSLRTVRDLEAKYGAQMFEVFGARNPNRRTNRMPQGRRAPLLLATLLVTVGWVAAVLTPHLRPVTPPPQPARDSDLLTLLTPSSSVVVFAFLGAYFFTIQAVLRGYVRRDLRPKTYSSISVRFVIVMILAWVVTVTEGGVAPAQPGQHQALWVLAFFTGVFPDTAIRYLREFLMSRNSVRQVLPSLYERAPLTDLEGIDVYDRSRLEDEGVTNIEALAHSDLVELMLQTRIPAARLVDWVDQAILYLHLGLYDEVDPEGPAHELRTRLRQHGIRTATGLLQAYRTAGERAGNGPLELSEALAGPTGSDPPGAPKLQVIVDALSEEEWLDNIVHWRGCGRVCERTREEHCPGPEDPAGVDESRVALVTATAPRPSEAAAATG
jgi:hypothetical protein